MANEIVWVSKHKLYRDEKQPRRHIKPESIEKKRQQLKEDGQVTPLLVWPPDPDGRYCIVDGECRWRAAMELPDDVFDEFRVEIFQCDRDDVGTVLLTQLLRNDDGSEPLTALEKAVAYKQLMEQHQDDDEKGSALKQVADKLGMNYAEFTKAIKVADMSPELSAFVLERGIDDRKAINGMMRVEQRGTRQHFDSMLDAIRENDENKEAREGGTSSTREIVSSALKAVKDPKARKTVKEKIKRKLEVRGVEFKWKEGGDTMVIETRSELITFVLSPEQAAKFKALDLTAIEANTATFKL